MPCQTQAPQASTSHQSRAQRKSLPTNSSEAKKESKTKQQGKRKRTSFCVTRTSRIQHAQTQHYGAKKLCEKCLRDVVAEPNTRDRCGAATEKRMSHQAARETASQLGKTVKDCRTAMTQQEPQKYTCESRMGTVHSARNAVIRTES